MDPVTHAFIGMAVAKAAGIEISFSEPAILAVTAGSVLPDIDIILQKWGHKVYLKNHRGVTHSFIGILASALAITAVLSLLLPAGGFGMLFLWAVLGGVSHSLADILNTYGTKIFWPFSNRKASFRLLPSFDPFLAGLLLGYVLTNSRWADAFMLAVAVYGVFRLISRRMAKKKLVERFCKPPVNISVLPMVGGFFRWHFIIEHSSSHLIGDMGMSGRSVKVRCNLKKVEEKDRREAVCLPLGKFFNEFTPLFHITCERDKGFTRYTFIDMRYYMRNKFLYQGELKVDSRKVVVSETFKPYSFSKKPTPRTRFKGGYRQLQFTGESHSHSG